MKVTSLEALLRLRALLRELDNETIRVLIRFIANAGMSGDPKAFILDALRLKLAEQPPPERVEVIITEEKPNR